MNNLVTRRNLEQADFPIGSLFYNVNLRYLHNSEVSIYLRHKLNQLLQTLVNNDGRIVSRLDLIDQIWGGNQYIGHKALTHSICKLRQHFSDLGEKKVKIVTVPKSGYLLVHIDALPSMNRVF